VSFRHVGYQFVKYQCPICHETLVEVHSQRAAYVRSPCCDARVPLNVSYALVDKQTGRPDGQVVRAVLGPTPDFATNVATGTNKENKP
jgi:hypothetical protein